MPQVSLVTGANGHLGNNLIRLLLEQGERVIAGTRNPAHADRFAALGCKVVHADLLDRPSLSEALRGVDVLYQVGAMFKHWAPNPERDIYQANMRATQNILEAAAKARVGKIVYVSSLAALDRTCNPITETGWNPDTTNVYFRSKTDAEKLAWELAGKLGLNMVSILPGAMIGPNCWSLTPTMSLLRTILDGKLTADPGFFFNFVDVRDVAAGCVQAADKGIPGERYLLANEDCTSVGEVVRLAQELFPQRNIKTSVRPPQSLMYVIVALIELAAKLRGREPAMQRNYLKVFSVCERCDISKARQVLRFDPRPPLAAIESGLRYLAEADEEITQRGKVSTSA